MTDQSLPPASVASPGAVLRALRRKYGWTLAEVSRLTGLNTSTLSKIENDRTSLTFEKLARLSAGLHVDILALLSEGEGRPASYTSGRRSIARGGEGNAIETGNSLNLYPAWDLLNKSMIPLVAELHAHSLEEFGELVRHPGEEYAHVLEGEVDLYTSLYAPVHLKAGDSIYFDSGMGHAYVAAREGPCRVLSLCTAPHRQRAEGLSGVPSSAAACSCTAQNL
ncbi:MAG: helix-turn-helix domain-containing protein [Steroidobacteraceae bacterium]